MDKKQRKNMIKKETFLLGLIGIFFGIVIGLILCSILTYVINVYLESYVCDVINSSWFADSILNKIDFYMKVPTFVLICVVLIVYAIVFISSMLSVRKINKINQIEAITNKEGLKRKSKEPKSIEKFFKQEGIIAYKNIKSDRSKYKTIILSLTASIILFLSVTGIADKFYELRYFLTSYNVKNYVASEELSVDVIFDIFEKQKGYDLIRYLKSNNLIEGYNLYRYDLASTVQMKLTEEQISKDLQKIVNDGVYSKDTQGNMYLNLDSFCFYDEAYDDILRRAGISELKDNEVIIMNTINQESKYGNKIRISNLKVGDSYTVLTNEGEKKLKVAGIVEDFNPYHNSNGSLQSPNLNQMLNENTMNNLGIGGYYILAVKTNDAYEINKRRSEINALFDYDGAFRMNNNSLFAISLKSQRAMTETIINLFIIILYLISGLNVFNIVSSSIILRKREFAVLKSIGMSNKQINKMITLEGVFYGVNSIICGIAISLVIQFMLYLLTTNSRLYGFKMPWKDLLICIVFICLIIFVTIKNAKKKIIDKNIIEEIKNENI